MNAPSARHWSKSRRRPPAEPTGYARRQSPAVAGGPDEAPPKPMGFMGGEVSCKLADLDFVKGASVVWIDGAYKLVLPAKDGERRLFDIYADPEEKANIAGKDYGNAN